MGRGAERLDMKIDFAKLQCFEYLGYKKENFPVAEKVSKEILSLPMNPYLNDKEIEYITDKVTEIAK